MLLAAQPGQEAADLAEALGELEATEELDRARHALALAATGRSVVVVSSGDPGIFAMAAAVMEALHGTDDPAWHGVELTVMPGISAAQGAAARAGAPLGHDFCILSLSDNLKPWEVIERRLDHAAAADLIQSGEVVARRIVKPAVQRVTSIAHRIDRPLSPAALAVKQRTVRTVRSLIESGLWNAALYPTTGNA